MNEIARGLYYGAMIVYLAGFLRLCGDVNFLVERMVAPSSCHYAATGI